MSRKVPLVPVTSDSFFSLHITFQKIIRNVFNVCVNECTIIFVTVAYEFAHSLINVPVVSFNCYILSKTFPGVINYDVNQRTWVVLHQDFSFRAHAFFYFAAIRRLSWNGTYVTLKIPRLPPYEYICGCFKFPKSQWSSLNVEFCLSWGGGGLAGNLPLPVPSRINQTEPVCCFGLFRFFFCIFGHINMSMKERR